MKNRTDRRGGGIGLLHRREYQANRIETNLSLDIMEHALWEVNVGNTHLTILAIYHPPLGNAGNTHTRFLDQVSD